MKIGFLSDTHGALEDTVRALELLEDCPIIFHLGDVLYHGPRNDLPKGYNPKDLAEILKARDNIYYIKGNCDSDVDEMVTQQNISKKERVFVWEAFGFYLVHGYEEDESDRMKRAADMGLKTIVTGHSHCKSLEQRDGFIFLNPGSTSLPKDGSKSVASFEQGVFKLIDLETADVLKQLRVS